MDGLEKKYRIRDLDRKTVKDGLADGSILLVDIREPYEFTAGHIPGSLSLPLSQFDPAALPQQPKARTVFTCAAGVRSENLLVALQDAGHDFSEHYRGGFKEWISAGEAVEY